MSVLLRLLPPLRRWRLKPFRTVCQGCNGFCPKPRPSIKPRACEVAGDCSSLSPVLHAAPGEIPIDLARCVPPVAMLCLFHPPPKFLPAGTVQQLLDHRERETRQGRGTTRFSCCSPVWVCEPAKIVALELDDIDWDNGRITIHGKGGRLAQIRCHPTSAKPSQAICASAAPCSTCRRVFSFAIALRCVVLHTPSPVF